MKAGRSIWKANRRALMLVWFAAGVMASLSYGDFVVDNRNSGTSSTGEWEVSGGSNGYGPDSLWGRNGATYTWHFESQPEGRYEVFMWWSSWPSRGSAIEVSVEHAESTDALLVNQQAGGGGWNLLGEYYFDGSGSVTIVAADGESVSTCADAVWFKYLDATEAVIIDNHDANTSRTGTWEVSGGSDPYGPDSVWSRDGGTFTWHFEPLQTGDYEISMWWTEWPSRSDAVPVEIVHAEGSETISINQKADTGKWNVIGVYPFIAGTEGTVTLLAAGAMPMSYCADAVKFALVTPDEAPEAVIDSIEPNPAIVGSTVSFEGYGIDSDGAIVAYNWSSSIDGDLSDAAAFSTATLSEGYHEITFKVQDDRGQWSANTSNVLVVRTAPIKTIVDNKDTETSSTGTWEVSAGTNPYGVDSLWSRNGGTFVWYFNPAESGEYEVSMWWTEYASRSTAAPVDIKHAGGKARVTINQLSNGGRWNSLGVFSFEQGTKYSVTLYAENMFPTSYCADAVKFTRIQVGNVPVAIIDAVEPNPAALGQTVTFTGHGSDPDGQIVAYSWESSIDGPLGNADSFSTDGLSPGVHQITLKVQDNAGQWSPPSTRTLSINAVPDMVIIDNTDENTSRTGTWEISGGSDPYGPDSVWSRDGGTFTWYFTPARSGEYEVSMCWSKWFSRSTSAPVDIVHAHGTERVVVNQQVNTGQWNSLGVYSFTEGVEGAITLIAEGNAPTSYCADAVKLALIEANNAPSAVIDSIEPNPALVGRVVAFEGHGTDPDGSIVEYRWTSSIDGYLSDTALFSTDGLSEGVHEISFEVQDNSGNWSSAITSELTVRIAASVTIIDNRSSNTSSTGTWEVSGGSNYYDVDSVWSRNGATFTWYFTPSESGEFEVSMWWTEWPSRSRSVPVEIVHANGTKNMTVDQWVNGGRWNSLGVYNFTQGVRYAVRLSAPNAFPTSYCADAVKFAKIAEQASGLQ